MVSRVPSGCPVCAQNANIFQVPSMIDVQRIECPRCGTFLVSGLLLMTVLKGNESDSETKELLPYLSAYIRQANARGERVVLEDNWRDVAMAHRNTPISRKVTKLLEVIAARTSYGHSAKLDEETDLSLVDAKDVAEFAFLLKHLTDCEYVSRTGGPWVYGLKVKGWDYLQPTAGIPGKCFVAMSFHQDLKEAFEKGIYLAVKEDCKMNPVKIDLVPHNDNIIDKIIAEIRTCQFMVADFTGHRGGVYFEAGFAKGLGRPVIWTCRKDDFQNIHFDIAQFSHIIWKDPGDLRVRLADRIKATIPMSG